MQLGQLDAKHPSYDCTTWEKYWALYKGGKTLRACVEKFITKNEGEPLELYQRRAREAAYRSYVGPIVDYYAAALMTSPPIARAKDEAGKLADADKFYAEWKEDCDGAGTDLVDFLRSRFRDMLVRETAWWVVEMPQSDAAPTNRADWRAAKLDRPTLRAVDAEDVLDWECDEHGQILWVIVHRKTTPRRDPRELRRVVRREWKIYDRTTVETYAIEYDPGERTLQPADEIALEDVRPHGFERVPVVRMHAPDGLWLVDRVGEAQTEHFRLSAGLGWAIRRTCYAMLAFKVSDQAAPPKMGTGYYMIIGEDEGVEWLCPPGTPFEVISAEVSTQKDEIYRVTNQMALGVENNAASVGRSAESKEVDASATVTCLHAFAAPVREAIELTYDLLSDGRGDDGTKWSIEGLDKFSVADARAVVDTATQAAMLNIPSRSFKVEMFRKTADALLPGVDQATKDAIHSEIEEGVEAESDMRDVMQEAEHDAKLTGIKTGAILPGGGKAAPPPPNGKGGSQPRA